MSASSRIISVVTILIRLRITPWADFRPTLVQDDAPAHVAGFGGASRYLGYARAGGPWLGGRRVKRRSAALATAIGAVVALVVSLVAWGPAPKAEAITGADFQAGYIISDE